MLATAQALAEAMAQNSPLAMRKAKEAMVASSGRSLDEAFGVEDQCIKVVLRSEDARGIEGVHGKAPAELYGAMNPDAFIGCDAADRIRARMR